MQGASDELAKLLTEVRCETIEQCVEWVRHEEGDGVADAMAKDMTKEKP